MMRIFLILISGTVAFGATAQSVEENLDRIYRACINPEGSIPGEILGYIKKGK